MFKNLMKVCDEEFWIYGPSVESVKEFLQIVGITVKCLFACQHCAALQGKKGGWACTYF
jgi:hypothetical protein